MYMKILLKSRAKIWISSPSYLGLGLSYDFRILPNRLQNYFCQQ